MEPGKGTCVSAQSVIGWIMEPGKGTWVSAVSYWVDHGAREGDMGLCAVSYWLDHGAREGDMGLCAVNYLPCPNFLADITTLVGRGGAGDAGAWVPLPQPKPNNCNQDLNHNPESTQPKPKNCSHGRRIAILLMLSSVRIPDNEIGSI